MTSEKKPKTQSRVSIYIEDKSIRFDDFQLHQAILFFIHNKLQKYPREKLPLMTIVIEKEEPDGKKARGCFFGIFKNEGWIMLNSKSIKRASINGIGYKKPLKELFCTFLHEFYHFLETLELYLYKNKENKNFEQIYEDENNRLGLVIEKLKESYDNEAEIHTNNPSEMNADSFAFENLSFFENLYDCQLLLIPDNSLVYDQFEIEMRKNEK